MKFNYEKKITIIGKMTEVELINTETGEVFIGRALCNPNDTFDAYMGIDIAETRANINRCKMEQHDLEYEKRKKINLIQGLKRQIDLINQEIQCLEKQVDLINQEIYDKDIEKHRKEDYLEALLYYKN